MADALRIGSDAAVGWRSVLLLARMALRGDHAAVNGANLGLLNAESDDQVEAAAAAYDAGALSLTDLFDGEWDECAGRQAILPDQANAYLVIEMTARLVVRLKHEVAGAESAYLAQPSSHTLRRAIALRGVLLAENRRLGALAAAYRAS